MHYHPEPANSATTSHFTVVRSTWLSRRPNPWAFVVAGAVTFLLGLASFAYWTNTFAATEWMPATHVSVFAEHSFWRAWSALFAHADGKHLLSNSFLFFILGSLLGGYFGFLMFPAMAFILGGVANLFVLWHLSPQTELLGASGIVFWMGGAWLTMYFLLDEKRTYYQRGLRTMGVALMLFFPAEAFDPHISYASHFWGFTLGILWAAGFYRYNHERFKSYVVRELIVEEPPAETNPQVSLPQ